MQSYRAFKQVRCSSSLVSSLLLTPLFHQDWTGYPLTTPSFAVNTSHAFASWNGATEIASWELLGGSSADSLSSISTNTKNGFETTMSYNLSYTYLSAAAVSSDVSFALPAPTIEGRADLSLRLQGTCLGVSEVYEVSSLATTGTAGTCPSGTTIAASGSGSSSSTDSTSAASSVKVEGLLGAVFAFLLIL